MFSRKKVSVESGAQAANMKVSGRGWGKTCFMHARNIADLVCLVKDLTAAKFLV